MSRAYTIVPQLYLSLGAKGREIVDHWDASDPGDQCFRPNFRMFCMEQLVGKCSVEARSQPNISAIILQESRQSAQPETTDGHLVP